MCGEERLIYVKNLSLRSPSRCCKAALIIKPPRECPMKLIFDRQDIGQKDWIYYLTSFASLSPISKMSPSVRSSLALLDKKIASGCVNERLFFSSLISD
jgi:hypothetical protein